jgi:hypothetical protein
MPALNVAPCKSRSAGNPVVMLLVAALAALALTGCMSVSEVNSMNAKMSASVTDAWPQWAGGLPPDAPPRAGTPEYDKWREERKAAAAQVRAANPNSTAPAGPGNSNATGPTNQ